jgi:hypothetical protein
MSARMLQILQGQNAERGGYNVGGMAIGGARNLVKSQKATKFASSLLKMNKGELDELAASLDLPHARTKGEAIKDILGFHNKGMVIKREPSARMGYIEEVEGEQAMPFTIVEAKKPRQRRVIKRAVHLVPGSKVKPMKFKIVKPKAVRKTVRKTTVRKVAVRKPAVRKVAVRKMAVRKVAGTGPCKKYKPGPKCKVNKNGACPSRLQVAAAKVNPWLRFMKKFRKESHLTGREALTEGSRVYKQMKAQGKLQNYLSLPYQGLRTCASKK